MFAKIFTQILDSSLAEDYQTRHVFEDLLKLCDINGVVDMTPEAIARRVNANLEVIKHGITELEKPDASSRNPEHGGRRIIRLDHHRDWGWLIVNYSHYRAIASEEQRREKTLHRVQRHRDKVKRIVTPCNARNAMQRQKQMKKNNDKASSPTKASKLSASQKDLANRIEAALGEEWINDAGKWINRIKAEANKCERVIAEVESAAKEGRINSTPARYAEQIWKEFAPSTPSSTPKKSTRNETSPIPTRNPPRPAQASLQGHAPANRAIAL